MSHNRLFSLLKENKNSIEVPLFQMSEAEFRNAVQECAAVLFPDASVFALPSEEYLSLLALCKKYYNREPFPKDAPLFRFSFSSLCSDLAFSADLSTPTGSILYSGTGHAEIAAAPRVLRWAILNLLSEALHACEEANLCLRLQEKKAYFLLAVAGDFSFSKEKFEAELEQAGSPLAYCLRAAKLHSGQLLFRTTESENAFLLCLPKVPCEALPSYTPETFDELLSDRFSVLYTALLP